MIRCPDKEVSRIVAYVKDGIIIRRREDLESEDFSAIWMEAGLPREKKFLVCGVYREWAYLSTDGHSNDYSSSVIDQERRWQLFLDSWEDALDQFDDVCVLGDVNIDLGKVFERRIHPCRNMADDLRLRILSRGVLQLVKDNTRFIASCEPSLLDHVYMSRPELGMVQVVEWGTSDHRLIELKKRIKGTLPQALRLRKRVFKRFSRKDFIQDVKDIKWYSSVYSKDNVDEATEGWQREFLKVLDKHCPVKSIQVRKNYTPWLTQDIILTSKSLQRAQRRARLHNSPHLQEFIIASKTRLLRDKLKNAKESWKMKEAAKMGETGAKTWENVKHWIGWRSTSQPIMLKDPSNDNRVTVGASRLSKIMNDFYLQKVRMIKENMLVTDGDPTSELKEMLPDGYEESELLTLRPITPELVLKTGKKMKKSKSMGKDDIPADIFLLALPFMLPAVTHIYNLSLSQAKFPSAWKASKICPLFKGGDRSTREDPKQYRPVAL